MTTPNKKLPLQPAPGKRYHLYMFNLATKQRSPALGKYTRLMTAYEANRIIRDTRGTMEEWVFKKEMVTP